MAKIILLLASLFLWVFGFSPALAEDLVIPASYQINYDVLESGQTNVNLSALLFNPRQDVDISEYSLLLGFKNLENLAAADSLGPIKPRLESTATGSRVTLNFNQRVVGTAKPLKFNLSYATAEVANRRGLIWEVVVPKAADLPQLKDYHVEIAIPLSFGAEISARPEPSSVEKKITKKIYRYSKEALAKTGAILSFGPFQLYSFNLKYNLKNTSLLSGTAQIALPPSILGEQEVIYDQIVPSPIRVREDPNGNYLAAFKLPGGQSTTVSVRGRAKILNPFRNLAQSGPFAEIPSNLKNDYLNGQKYWETEHAEIKKILANLSVTAAENDSVGATAQIIFNFVVQNLNYDQSRIQPNLTRFGALKSLSNAESAVCMEFADLLITLLRAAKIPAQLLEGFVDSRGDDNRPAIGDVLHSWVRLYVPRLGWVQVDPTWANTTGGLDYFSRLDTNHFDFVIKGLSSETPFPAGAYKVAPDQVGDIEVKVLDNVLDLPNLEDLINSQYLTQSSRVVALITNAGKGTLFGVHLNGKNFGNLPPFGAVSEPVSQGIKLVPGQSLGKMSYLNFAGKVLEKNLVYTPALAGPAVNWPKRFMLVFGIVLVLGLCSFLYYSLFVKASPG